MAQVAMMFAFASCTDESVLSGDVMLDNEVNQFVWQGMNLYYFWQSDVANLTDNRFSTTESLTSFLNAFPDPQVLFNSLLFPSDRFSWIVDDYVALDNSFQGVSKSFGYEFKLVNISSSGNELFGYVEYVIPNSPASEAGLERGDVFYLVNGQQLTVDNYRDLMIDSDHYTLSLANFRDNTFSLTGEEMELTAVELEEDPVFFYKILDVADKKVGYLVYNQFVSNDDAHLRLNDVFGLFLSKGISELVLDLRYNPGGALFTCRLLASMIYGAADESTVLGSLVFNDKVSDLNSDFKFLSNIPLSDTVSNVSMNRLDINRVFVLTTSGTASASELIIAGLQPYLDVVVIGEKTTGKNESSITLYDSPDKAYLSNDEEDVNLGHRYAMQPIVSKLTNSQSLDYSTGITPLIALDETDFFSELLPLGEKEEPLLKGALGIISGTGREGEDLPLSADFRDVVYDSRAKSYLQATILDSREAASLVKSRLHF